MKKKIFAFLFILIIFASLGLASASDVDDDLIGGDDLSVLGSASPLSMEDALPADDSQNPISNSADELGQEEYSNISSSKDSLSRTDDSLSMKSNELNNLESNQVKTSNQKINLKSSNDYVSLNAKDLNDVYNKNSPYKPLNNTFESIQELINQLDDGCTILLEGEYIGSGNQIILNKSINLVSNASVLNAMNLSRCLNVTASDLLIQGIEFRNTNTTLIPKATFFNGGFTLASAGAIFIYGNNVTVDRCSFINITVNEKAQGVCIYWNGSNGCLNNSIFVNNSQYSSYGIINWKANGGIINNCSFLNNSRRHIYWSGSNALINNSTICDTGKELNDVSLDGGYAAVHLLGTNSTVNNTYFLNSGGIYSTINLLLVNNSNFINISGRAVDHPYYYKNDTTINNCSFINVDDNAVRLGQHSFRNLIKNSTFINNHGAYGGGAIYTGSHTDIESCIFINNSANFGGAVCGINNQNISIFNSSFIDNQGAWGTAISSDGSNKNPNYSIRYCIFDSDVNAPLIRTSSKIPEMDYNYWAMNITNKNDFISKSLVVANGTSIAPNNWILMSLTGLNYLNLNESSSYTFALDKLCDGVDILEFNGSLPDYTFNIFQNNIDLGTYIIFSGEKVTYNLSYDVMDIYEISARSPVSGKEEAHIQILVGVKTFDFIQKLIDDADDGDIINIDGLYISAGKSIIVNKSLSFIANYSVLDALKISGIFNISAENVSISNVILRYSNSDYGAVYSNASNTILKSCNFNDNKGLNHGAALNLNGDNAFVDNCSFSNNIAHWGSAIYSNGENLTVSSSQFLSNGASDSSAAVLLIGKGAKIINSSFINSIGQNGSAVYVNASDVLISNSTFYNNSAEYGVVYNDKYDSDNLVIYFCNFILNKADYGSAICLEGHANVSNSIFDSNSGENCVVYVDFDLSKYGMKYGEDASHAFNLRDNFWAKNIYDANDFLDSNMIYDNLIGTYIVPSNWVLIDFNGETNPDLHDNLNYTISFGKSTDGIDIYDSDLKLPDYKVKVHDGKNLVAELLISSNPLSYRENSTNQSSSGNEGDVSNSTEQDIQENQFNYSCDKFNYTFNRLGSYTFRVYSNYSNIVISSFRVATAKTFEDIQYLIDIAGERDTIHLNGTYISIGEAIRINKTVTIEGDSLTLDALGLSGIFNVTADNVEIYNVTFKNALSSRGGAILFSGSDCILDNCLFANNSARSGGAIYTTRGLYIYNSVFRDNQANNYGGAIYSLDSDYLLVDSSLFKGNNAKHGGAIYLVSDDLNLENSSFLGNNASEGSDIYLDVSDSNDVSINNNIFDSFNLNFLNSYSTNSSGNDSSFDSNRSSNSTSLIFSNYDIDFNANYWAWNFKNESEFIDAGLVSIDGVYSAPASWILMSIDGPNQTSVGNGVNFTLSLSKIYNDGVIGDYYEGLPDYDVNVFDENGKILLTIPSSSNCSFHRIFNSLGSYDVIVISPQSLNDLLSLSVDVVKSGSVILANDSTIFVGYGSLNIYLLAGEDIDENDSSAGIPLVDKDIVIIIDDEEDNEYYLSTMENGLVHFDLSNLPFGNHTIKITFFGDSKYDGSYKQVNVEAIKLNTSFNMEDSYSFYVDSINLPLNLSIESIISEILNLSDDESYLRSIDLDIVIESLNGSNKNLSSNFTVHLDNSLEILDLRAILSQNHSLDNDKDYLPDGNYSLKLIFNGDDKYMPSSKEINLSLNKYNSLMSYELIDEKIIVSLSSYGAPIANRTIYLIVEGGERFTSLSNEEGVTSFDLSKLKNGAYNISLEFTEDYLYKDNFIKDISFVKNHYLSSNLTAEMDNKTLIISLNCENGILINNESIEITGLGEAISIPLNNSRAIVDLSKIKVGNYTAVIDYKGNDEINPAKLSVPISIEDAPVVPNSTNGSSGNVSDINGTNGTNGTVPVNGTNGTNGTVPVNGTNGTNDTKPLKEIKTAKDLQELIDKASPGSIVDLGNFEYVNVSNIKVNKDITLKGDNTTISSAGDGKPLFAIDGNLSQVKIEGIEFKANNGDVIVKASALNGTKPLSIDVPAIEISNNTITGVDSSVVAESITVLELESERGVLAPSNTIKILGNTLDSGMKPFKFDVKDVSNGSDVKVDAGGNIDIKKKPSLIVYKDMVTPAINYVLDGRNGEYFNVTLTDANGKPLANKELKIGFNGKIYNKTTDDEGKANLQINLKKVDLYTFAMSFLGDDEYEASFAVAKITVTAQNPKLLANKKTYKANAKTKTLTASLKTSRGNPLTGKAVKFTLNGKTYSAKTNSKGVATVKVSLSKRKTYAFSAKFAGDTTYAPISTKGTLVIK